MSSKRDWNDMSDDDSEQQKHHHQQDHQEQIQQIPSLNKIISSPLPNKRSANEQENLLKLQNSKNEQIWLYIPLFYRQSVDEVDKILRNVENLIRIQKFIKGWNVLTRRENARQYIVQGIRKDTFLIKFYFSNKNDQSEINTPSRKGGNYYKNNDNYDNKKVKYIPKSPNSKGQLRDLKSPEALRKIESQQQHNALGRTPKSPNYKNPQWKKNQDSRDYRAKNYNKQSNKRQDDDSLTKDRNYKPKYVTKKSQQQAPKGDKQYNAESPKRKYVQKTEQQSKIETPTQNTKLQTEQKKQQSPAQQDDSQQTTTPNEKKPKKKKNKKNQMVKDSNNPFAMLNGI